MFCSSKGLDYIIRVYRISWDKKTGGVVLHSHVTSDTLGITPRPVFWEELDLLKLNQLGWVYPHCEEPLLWACNKQYFYRGEPVFEVKGANIYDPATIVFLSNQQTMNLKPVDVKKMIEINNDFMFLIESEAIEFIRETYLQYSSANKSANKIASNKLDYNYLLERAERNSKQKMAIVKEDCESFDIMPLDVAKKNGKKIYHSTRIDRFLASFSGGKDSQVVLDLCTRSIPSTDFEVIYSDTGYELPTSLSLYDEVQSHYGKLYPDLKFSVARNHDSVLNYWDKIGTPSDTHRWCCSVMKTAPLYRMLKIEGTNKQAKVLTFDGVRSEESVRRSSYDRVGKGKHTNIWNAHPIMDWNTVEIFLYLFKYNLSINKGYRYGKSRVGCLVCPFTSFWDDMVNNHFFPQEMSPFIERISSYSQAKGISLINDFIKERKWKIKSLGNPKELNSKVTFKNAELDFIALLDNPKIDILCWLPALCDFTYSRVSDELIVGELNYKKSIYQFQIIFNVNNQVKFIVKNIIDNSLKLLLKRIAFKSCYCVKCEVCEVDCPTGALSILPDIHIDKSKCIHCHKCIRTHERGCIAADCIRMINDTDKKINMKIQGYKTFGLREDWIDEYFMNPELFWGENSLGTAQVDGLKAWLKDAEIIDVKNNITELGMILKDIYEFNPNIFWEIAFINLSYNSFIVKWFVENVKIQQNFNKKVLFETIQNQGYEGSTSTLKNAISALIDLLKKSLLGEEMQQAVQSDKTFMRRQEYENINDESIVYSIYKYAQLLNVKTLRVSDLYGVDVAHGVNKEFCISKSAFEKSLRHLTVDSKGVLIADLNMGLDHITLRDDLDPIQALKIIVGL